MDSFYELLDDACKRYECNCEKCEFNNFCHDDTDEDGE